MITGWVLAVVAFVLAGSIWNAVFGMDASFWVASLAGFFTWKYFNDKYKREMQALLNPPAQVWALRMEDAWTCLEDVLATAFVETGVSGISRWRIVSKDNNRGLLQAQMDFKQALGSPADPKIFGRTIILDAQLTPEGEATKVEIQYHIMSPSGTGMVEDCIKKTQASMVSRVAIVRGV